MRRNAPLPLPGAMTEGQPGHRAGGVVQYCVDGVVAVLDYDGYGARGVGFETLDRAAGEEGGG